MRRIVRLSERQIIFLNILLCVVVLGLDAATPLGVNTAMLYLSVIFMSLAADRTRIALIFGLMTSLLTTLGMFLSGGNYGVLEDNINRLMVIITVWLLVVVGTKFKHAQKRTWILAAMVESSAEAIVGMDAFGNVMFWNNGAQKLYGYTADEMRGRSIRKVIPADRLQEKDGFLAKLRKGESLIDVESTRLRKDGSEFPVLLSLSPILGDAGKFIGVATITRDITRRKERELETKNRLFRLRHQIIHHSAESRKLKGEVQEKDYILASRARELGRESEQRRQKEQELMRSQKRLKQLTAHLTNIREHERKVMAREVHDELGQLLTALKMDLAWIGDNALAGEREKFLTRLDEANNLIDTIISSVQRIVAKLRPSILDDLGIVEAVKWQAREFEKRAKIPCDVRVATEGVPLTGDAATALFRICQEALTNVARHAGASRVDITLTAEDGAVMLEVTDDGRGLTVTDRNAAESFGLMGMRERAEMFGGELDIESAAGKGTTVRLRVPLSETAEVQP